MYAKPEDSHSVWSSRTNKVTFFTEKQGVCLSPLSVQCLGVITVLWDPKTLASLATKAKQYIVVPWQQSQKLGTREGYELLSEWHWLLQSHVTRNTSSPNPQSQVIKRYLLGRSHKNQSTINVQREHGKGRVQRWYTPVSIPGDYPSSPRCVLS